MAYNTTTTARDTAYSEGELIAYKAKAAEIFKKGDVVIVKAADGLAYKGFAAAGAAAGDIFVGLAYESKTAAAGDTDLIRAQAYGVHTMVAAGLAITDTGAKVWHDQSAAGAANVVTTSTGDAAHAPAVGIIVEFITATSVRVKISGYASSIGGIAA